MAIPFIPTLDCTVNPEIATVSLRLQVNDPIRVIRELISHQIRIWLSLLFKVTILIFTTQSITLNGTRSGNENCPQDQDPAKDQKQVKN